MIKCADATQYSIQYGYMVMYIDIGRFGTHRWMNNGSLSFIPLKDTRIWIKTVASL